MEQRTGPNTPPLHAAGLDPAAIPGLTVPPPAAAPEDGDGDGAEEARAEEVRDATEARTEPAAEAPAKGGDGSSGKSAAAVPASADEVVAAKAATDESGTAGAADDSGSGEAPDEEASEVPARGEGPVFEVSDRRAAILVNAEGVTFRLDDEVAEFDWSEIGAVEISTPRFGRRFTVTLYTGPRRWYEGEVEAPGRSHLKQWAADLDAALDAWFDDGGTAGERRDGEKAQDGEKVQDGQDGRDLASEDTDAEQPAGTEDAEDAEDAKDAD